VVAAVEELVLPLVVVVLDMPLALQEALQRAALVLLDMLALALVATVVI
jgi:hypothetical protein